MWFDRLFREAILPLHGESEELRSELSEQCDDEGLGNAEAARRGFGMVFALVDSVNS